MITNTHKDIQIDPYEFDQLLNLKITQEINNHSYIYITGLIDESVKDTYLDDTNFGRQINVTQILDNQQKILFKGMVLEVEIKHINSMYYMNIKGVSNSYLYDIKLKSRSFQDIGATYESIFNIVAGDYSGGGIMDKATNHSTTGKYIIQYRESDWIFVKRLASRFNAGLVASIKHNEPKFYVGSPEISTNKNLEEFNYKVRKRIKDYAVSSQNTNPQLSELDRVEYTIESTEYLELCEPVKYKDILLYVSKCEQEIKEEIVTNTYILTTKKGLTVDEVFNDNIRGVSLQASVIGHKNDCVKVYIFPIDESQDVAGAYNFPYTTNYTAEGNSGWYCMPEIGDTVYIYHPTNRDEAAVSVNSIRTQGSGSDKTSDPSTKYWRTIDGKEIKLSPEEILITAKDDEIFIKLNENDGIQIYSTKPISINTLEALTISATNGIKMTADNEISMVCKSSKIQMDGEILIEGKKIKNNS